MADVQLRTLRVSAELDASAYAAGAAEKESADKRMSASSREVAAAITQTDTRLSQASNGVERLMRSFVEGYNDTQRLTSALNTLSRGMDTGAISARNADAALAGIIRRYGGLADVAQVAERFAVRGQTVLAQKIVETNALLRQQTTMIADNDNSSSYRRQNLGYQLFDVAQSAALGMSPAMILMQQGPQIAQLYAAQGGLNAALKDFGAILAGVARVAGPVIAGLAALYGGYRMLQSFSVSASLAVDDSTRALAAQAAPVSALKGQISELTQIQSELNRTIAESARTSTASIETIIANSKREFEAKKALLDLELVLQEAKLRTQQADIALAGQAMRERVIPQIATDPSRAVREGFADPRINGGIPFVRLPDEISGLQKTMEALDADPAKNEITKLRAEMTIAELAVEKLREVLLKPFTVGAAPSSGLPSAPADAVSTEASAIQSRVSALRQEAGARADIVEQMQAKRSLLQGQNDEIDRLRLEAQLIGASERERVSLTAALQAEQQLRQQGINLASQEAQAYKANAVAIAQARLEIERQNAAFASLQQAGGSAIDSLTVGTGSLQDRFKAMADTMLQWVQQLAIANPLKNALFGSNLPTLSDLFSGKPAIPGATTTGMMTVTAGTVMVNGGVMGGQFPSIPGTTLPGTSTNGGLLSLIGATNGVRPSLTPSGIVNSPVALTAANQNSALSGLMNDPSLANRVNVSSQTELYRQAISKIESGSYAGNYSAIGPMTRTGDRAYGRYQVMGANVPSWTEQHYGQRLTPSQFLANQKAQDSVFDGEFGSYVSKYGEGPAATKWFTGSHIAKGRSDGYTVDHDYQSQFENNLKKLSSSTASTAKGVDVLGDSSTNASSTITDSFSKLASPAAVPAVPAVTPTTPTASGGGLLSGLFGGIFKLFGFADGTENAPGGLAIVGERGKELVNLPRGSQVTPTHKMGPNSEERARGDRNGIDVGVKVSIDQNGNLQAFVEGVSRRNAEEAARTGIRAYDARMPDRIDEISRNPYERAA